MASAQAERDAAKAAYKHAAENGDFEAQAEAQSKISRAEAKILRFEDGAAELAERKPETERRTEPVSKPSFEASVNANPRLLQAEKDWMIRNRTAFDNPDFNILLESAYTGAMSKGGMVRALPSTSTTSNAATGLKKADNNTPSNDTERDASVSAPPSRGERDASGKFTNGKVIADV